MAYSESLAGRVRDALARTRGIEEKTMFGGIGFLLHGNLLVGVCKDSLIARLGPDDGELALQEAHVRPFDITGRPMKNWILADPEGLVSDTRLAEWIQRAMRFVVGLPRK
jgi:hypothetical protein